MTNRTSLLAMIGAGLLLGLSGPFDTRDVLSLPQSLIYWVCVAISSFTVGSGISAGMSEMIGRRMPRFVGLCLTSVAIGTGVMVLIFGLNYVVFSHAISFAAPGPTFLTFVAIAGVIVVGLDLARHDPPQGSPADSPADNPAAPPPIMDRLPFDLRGDLIWLSVEDHYVQIATTKGREMILLRLSDAIREVGETRGLQVHRSHWVALNHIRSVKRHGDRATITLSTGEQVPVSRRYLPEIRAAGLLTRSNRV